VPGFVHDRFSSFYPFAAMSPPLRRFDLESHGLRWRRAPAALAHVRPDGTAALLTQDLGETAQRLDRASPGDGRAWRLLAERWTRLEPGIARAFFTPFPPIVGSARIALATDPRDLVRLARFMALPARRMGDEYFGGRDGPDLLSGMALHANLAPEDVGSGAFGWIMCGLAQTHGLPVPEGGASMLSMALVRRLEGRGGRVVCQTPAERVLIDNGRARGVRSIGGAEWTARRAVLADVDARTLYLGLIGREHLSTRVRSDLERFQRDASTVKVDWTLDSPIPWTAPDARRAGTLHVACGIDELSRTMNEITCGLLPRDPFLVMGQYAVTDPTRQPPGRDTAWAYTHVPQQPRGDAAGELGGDLTRELDAFADRIQARVEACAPGFTSRIRHRRIAGPQDLQAADRNLVGGDINGGTAHLHQLALFRPIPAQLGRPATPVRGLYLASASAHPSGGVHGAPGAIAARAALLHATPHAATAALRAGARRATGRSG
jgi:phytoene dehydrogenase-like protein